jgi:4-hydroxybenzoate polyprenyltransferase
MASNSPSFDNIPWQVIKLLRWDKPAGRLILMVPALWALVMAAEGQPPLILIGVIVLGTLATSAAGCVVNDLWDRNIDPQVERTKTRPLASRKLSVITGFVIMVVSLVCAWGLTLYLTPLSFWLSVASVPVILTYPSFKRFFPMPQLILSIAWGFAVLISWSAVTGSLNPIAWLLWGATVLWTLGFDTIYALCDREDDLKIGVNSSAIFFGPYVCEIIAVFFAMTAVLLGAMAYLAQLNLLFWVTLTIALIMWLNQYLKLKKPNIPRSAYGKMFKDNVTLGFILLGGMVMGYL